MADSDYSYSILRYDPTTGTVQYFAGANWYDIPISQSGVLSTTLTGFSAGAGTVTSADTVLTAFNKIVGNSATIPNLSVTPAKISTTATDDFSFPRDVTVGRNLLMTGVIGNAGGNRLNTAHPGFQIVMVTNADNALQIDLTSGSTQAGWFIQYRDHTGSVVGGIDGQGVMHPVTMTNTQRDALTATEGMTIYSTTDHAIEFYNGTTWKQVATV